MTNDYIILLRNQGCRVFTEQGGYGVMKRLDSTRNAQRERSNRDELIDRMATAVPTDGTVEVLPGFRLSRASSPSQPVRSVYEPSFCFVAQGSKRALLGGEIFRYDPRNYLIFTVDLPV